ISLARQKALPVEVALWIPNILFLAFGTVMLARLETPGDRDFVGWLVTTIRKVAHAPQTHLPRILDYIHPRVWLARFPMLPQLVDTYILASFLFYFGILLVSFVLMTHVFTFFELLSDIIKNHIALSRVVTYLVFLTPRLIYDFTPVAVLTAVLVVFG